MTRIKKELLEFKILLKSIPPLALVLFIVAILAMNLLANKSILLPFDWLALDCGIIISWLAFLTMDIMTKHFGPKAATEISIFAILINLIFCLIFFVGSKIPGVWEESFTSSNSDLINDALNNTFGGTWYVLFGSTVAFIASAFVNNFTNWGIGKMFKKHPDGVGAYVTRTYVSTMLGQFVDNMLFALIVSHVFFGWTILQCVTCALTGMFLELLFEIIFSYLGFKILKKWKNDKIGEEYLKLKERDEE